MQGYSAVVTGGAQGIGKAISAALAEAGMHVVILDLDGEAGRETEKELSRGTSVVFLQGDAAEEADVRAAVAAALKLGKGLRAAVSNTGIAVHKPVTKLSLKEWNRVLAVNLGSGFLLAKHAAAALKRRDGAMVLIGSSRAVMSEPDWEAYGASKGGVVALAHALAISLGPRVRVNCLIPGLIETEEVVARFDLDDPAKRAAALTEIPQRRIGTPEDVADALEFLVGAGSAYLTGQKIIVDGGQFMW